MTWLKFLFHFSFVYDTALNVILLFTVYPAFRFTRHRGFEFLFWSALLAMFDVICDHTIGLQHMADPGYTIYRTLRKFTHFTVNGLGTAGIILLTRWFLSLLRPRNQMNQTGADEQIRIRTR
jgi:prolipoprotein diacylglyceryltransferase